MAKSKKEIVRSDGVEQMYTVGSERTATLTLLKAIHILLNTWGSPKPLHK